jgi:mannose/fructose-specific phosphotransferase system component IIA
MQWFRLGLASVVTVVWLAGYTIAFVTHGPFPTELTGLMTLVVGWAFGAQVVETIRGKKASDEAKKVEKEDKEDAA